MNKPLLKIAFFGTPDLCIPYLDALVDADLCPSLIVTNPDRKIGSGKKRDISVPAPKQWAQEHHVEVLQPEIANQDFIQELISRGPWDLFVVVAYGKILPGELLQIPRFGSLNVHYSLLPRWRGASPVEAAIIAGDTVTGVSIQRMIYQLDAGDILIEKSLPLRGDEYAHDLRRTLTQIGSTLLPETIIKWTNGTITATQQDDGLVTHCYKISKDDAEINVDETSDIDLWRKYRAYYPWPGLFYFDGSGKRIKISRATFDDHQQRFIIEKIIPEGKPEQNYFS